MNSSQALEKVDQLINSQDLDVQATLDQICGLLQENYAHYDWVGFYFRNGKKEELKLKSFAGSPTDHNIIAFGKGICGQVAVSNQNFVVPDVKAQDNYIACSINVKSEIVIPLFAEGENIGQIDIDSHQIDAFTKEDEQLLTEINTMISQFLQKEKALPIFA
ncbi:MAG: GAF domain-containing protein [Psychroflexus maritimus]